MFRVARYRGWNNIILTHNYGHGEKFLSSLLVSLMCIALLFHTVLDLVDGTYTFLRACLSSRKEFFRDCRALIRYLCFESEIINYSIQPVAIIFEILPGTVRGRKVVQMGDVPSFFQHFPHYSQLCIDFFSV